MFERLRNGNLVRLLSLVFVGLYMLVQFRPIDAVEIEGAFHNSVGQGLIAGQEVVNVGELAVVFDMLFQELSRTNR